ncbi:hypothetical protein [Stieleria marina]|uniref:Uncharacterized protein n=1 Tax=Stieleria marina TaxID=1930275 RepID=A0A517P290_9BACT|nr:hypothetical protein K239x_55030 [Planctomycetes bacterium K23_9]
MSNTPIKPYVVAGAESLSASLFKTEDEVNGFEYRFNITRLDSQSASISHWLRPDDIVALLKLTRLLAAELDFDGCIDFKLRLTLRGVADLIDQMLVDLASADSPGANRS